MSQVLPFYSFAQFNFTLIGVGGTASLGFGSGAAEEGVALRFTSPQADKQMGADGSGSQSILLDRSVEITVVLQQTSETNNILKNKYNIESTGLVVPYNVGVLRNGTTEIFTVTGVVLMTLPDFTFASKTTNREWKYSGISCQFA